MKLFGGKSDSQQPRRRSSEMRHVSKEALPLERDTTFRRNRTLTGSVSSRIASAGEANADMKSARVHAHELTQKRRYVGALFLGVFMIAVILLILIGQFTAKVTVKADVGQVDESYQNAIQDYLAVHPVERLRFLLDSEQLTHYLQSKTPEVASVKDVTFEGFGASEFKVEMRTPIAGWNIQNKQQYVDASGVAFARSYFPVPNVQIIDNSGAQQVQAGQTVASNRFLGFVGRTVGLATTYGLTVTQVIIPAGTTREVELRVEGFNAPVKLTIDRTAGEQVEDMAKALAWFKAQSKTPEYIDVRVSGRAFYK